MGRLKDLHVFGKLEEFAKLWTISDDKGRKDVDELVIGYISENTKEDDVVDIVKYSKYYQEAKR